VDRIRSVDNLKSLKKERELQTSENGVLVYCSTVFDVFGVFGVFGLFFELFATHTHPEHRELGTTSTLFCQFSDAKHRCLRIHIINCEF